MRCQFALCLAGSCLIALPGDAWSADDLQLDLEGEITATCEISGFGRGNRVDLEAAANATIDFDIDCNLPMQIELSAENGALVNQAMAGLEASGNGWSASKPYDATLTIDGIGFAETASGERLKTGVVFSTGAQIPFDTGGALRIEVRDDGQRYPAGSFADVIRIVVSADQGAPTS